MSVTMGNAIRELKVKISNIDIDMVEQDVCTVLVSLIYCLNHLISQAKDSLCQYIDNYVRDRITLADKVIEDLAGKKIKDGDVILTYAK